MFPQVKTVRVVGLTALLLASAGLASPASAGWGLFGPCGSKKKCKPPRVPEVHVPHAVPVAWWAHPSEEKYDGGYYVGGGVPVMGEGRTLQEGTWGWDYMPPWSRVQLWWTHGRRYQDGEGQYEPDERNNPLRSFRGPR